MLTISAIPAFNDNYIWAIHSPQGDCAVVDPGDAKPVEEFLASKGLNLCAILITHHHFDHVGGISALSAARDIPVFGPDNPKIAGLTKRLLEGDDITIAKLKLSLRVLEVPGHTLDHIAYYSSADNWLFCGDTLFHCGCGRLFEGSPGQMLDSLNKLAALPSETAIYCTHEYTLANMQFALAADPDNLALQAAQRDAQQLRDRQQPTLPTRLQDQLAINPFLRSDDPALASRTAAQHGTETTPVAVFSALRAYKDRF